MRFKIAYSSRGRIRLRCGGGCFSKEQEAPLNELLLSRPYVKSAVTSSVNGGLLIMYDPPCRDELLTFVRSIKVHEVEKRQAETDRLTDEFKRKLLKAVIRRALMRRLIPAPIRPLLTYLRAVPYVNRALKSALSLHADVALLDGAAISAALARGMYSEVNSIMFLLGISELLEDYTKKRTKTALAESLSIKADTVWKVEADGTQRRVPISSVKKDDVVVFRSGAMISVDGTVEAGHASVNESSMTGESASVLKREGATVYAGTVIEEGSVNVRVMSEATDTRISHIIDMIENGEAMKAAAQSRAEKAAGRMVPYTLGLSALTYLVTGNVTKALSALMVDYSCAIKLAAPISIISAMREASGHGFAVKGGKHLEIFSEADVIVFDKTGTLTAACPAVEKVIPFGDYNETQVLKISACLEEHFPHSMAHAIVSEATRRKLNHEEEHTEVEYVVAHGIATTLHGKRAIIGSEHFIVEDEAVRLTKTQREVIAKETDGYSAVYLAIDGALAGVICISDPPRPEAAKAIEMLKKSGIKEVIMLTGDHASAAARVAKDLGIEHYKAQILPEDKARIVSELQASGKTVIMVGDGINDSPALALSDVSVAMKDSSDLAREVADITLLSGDIRDLELMRRLSKRLFRRISRSYGFIIAFNTALILLGIGGFITPSLSSLLHNTSTMLISANNMRPLLKNV